MLRRVVAACLGALVFGAIAPVTVLLLAGWPEQGMTTLALLTAAGAAVGAALGALLPGVFGFVLDVLIDS